MKRNMFLRVAAALLAGAAVIAIAAGLVKDGRAAVPSVKSGQRSACPVSASGIVERDRRARSSRRSVSWATSAVRFGLGCVFEA
jgi:hypothetical protein